MAKFNFNLDVLPPSETREDICSLTITQNVLQGRWKPLLIWYISLQPQRFGELTRLLPGISKGILAKQLKELEEDGLIQKEIFDELPFKVEYTLTALGEQLLPVIATMQDWGKKYIDSRQK